MGSDPIGNDLGAISGPMDVDTAYDAVAEVNDIRWAYGTGFDAPLSAEGEVPDGVDRTALATYCLMLGDDALIMSHRLQEWLTCAPELEEEVALANLALDLLGQARLLLSRAGIAEGSGRTEDDYAFGRQEQEFRNVCLVELERGDFAHEIARLLVFSTWRLAELGQLVESRDPVLSAVAAKAVKELSYHRDYAVNWTLRLGDGTDESHRRMCAGLAACWPYVDELFRTHPIERRLSAVGVAVDPADLRAEFDDTIARVLAAATVPTPNTAPATGPDGRGGRHTPALRELLSELQSVARTNPGATW